MYMTNMSNKGINYTDDWKIGSISYCDAMSVWNSLGLQPEKTSWSVIPAWSLHRLLEIADMHAMHPISKVENWYDDLIAHIQSCIHLGYINKEYLNMDIVEAREKENMELLKNGGVKI